MDENLVKENNKELEQYSKLKNLLAVDEEKKQEKVNPMNIAIQGNPTSELTRLLT